MNDPGLKKLRDETRKTLRAGGWLNQFRKPKAGTAAKEKKNGSTKKSEPTATQKQISAAEFQARVVEYIPRLESVGLTATQIKGVLAILDVLFAVAPGSVAVMAKHQ